MTPKYLDAGPVDAVLNSLPGQWAPKELSAEDTWALGVRCEWFVGAAASGVPPQWSGALPRMYGYEVVAGFTVLRNEPLESRRPAEPEGNADHYVLVRAKPPHGGYLRYGPYSPRDDGQMEAHAGIPHWHGYEDVSRFVDWIQLRDPPDEGSGANGSSQ